MPNQITKNDFTIFLFHPTTVIVMFILDWGGFVLEIPQLLSPITLVLTFLAIFSISGLATYFLQMHFAGETKRTAIIKAMLAGLICAVPAPMMSTIVGTIVLALSGFDALKEKGLQGLVSMFEVRNSDRV
jgi:hypothetical protein